MKNVSSVITNIINNYPIDLAILIKLGGQNYIINQRETMWSYDIVHNSETYTSTNQIISLSVPTTSDTLDKEEYQIIIGDNTLFYKPYLDYGINGIPIEVFSLFINTTGATITSTSNISIEPNQIINDPLDKVIIYKGLIGGGKYEVNYESGEARLILSCVSELAKLENKFTYRVNNKFLPSNDTAFEFVAENKRTYEAKWGKV